MSHRPRTTGRLETGRWVGGWVGASAASSSLMPTLTLSHPPPPHWKTCRLHACFLRWQALKYCQRDIFCINHDCFPLSGNLYRHAMFWKIYHLPSIWHLQLLCSQCSSLRYNIPIEIIQCIRNFLLQTNIKLGRNFYHHNHC